MLTKLSVILSILIVSLSSFCFGQNDDSKSSYRVIAYKKSATETTSTSNVIEITNRLDIFIPNAFTPNNDAVNDYFSIKGRGIDEIEITIFNKWGELIYQSNDLNFKWDGIYKGELVQQGVYSYVVRLKNDSFHEWKLVKGHVTVVK